MFPLRSPLCRALAVALTLALLTTPAVIIAAPHSPPFSPAYTDNDAEPPTTNPLARILIHAVRPGETLKQIAASYGTNIWALAEVNGLDNPDLIHPGQHLVIPQDWAPSATALTVAETISISDTLEPTVDNIQAYIIVVFAPLGLKAQAWGLRVAKCESNYNPRAVNERGNWHGLFQYHPETWAEFSEADIYDWQEQVRVSAYLYSLGQTWRWVCR